MLALVCNSTNVFQDEPSGSEAGVHEGLRAEVAQGEGTRPRHDLRLECRTAADDRPRCERDRPQGLHRRPLARPDPARVAKATGYLEGFPEPVGFDEAMRLAAEGGADHRDGRAGRATRRARSHCVGQSRPQADRRRHGDLLLEDHSRQRGRHRPDHERLVRSRRDHRHRSAGACPCLRSSRAGRNWLKCTIGSGPRSSCRCTASRGTWPSMRASRLAHGVPQAVVQHNGDVVRLAPDGPKKLDEVRVGRLVLDGDVILPADGSTITERRRLGFSGLITRRAAGRRRWRACRKPLDPAIRSAGRRGSRRLHRRRDRFRTPGLQSGSLTEDKLREAVRLAVRRCATAVDGQEAAR